MEFKRLKQRLKVVSIRRVIFIKNNDLADNPPTIEEEKLDLPIGGNKQIIGFKAHAALHLATFIEGSHALADAINQYVSVMDCGKASAGRGDGNPVLAALIAPCAHVWLC